MTAPRHIFQTFIQATPEAIWQAITDPDLHPPLLPPHRVESSSRPVPAVRYVLPDGADAVVGVIEEIDPPHRLVHDVARAVRRGRCPRSRRAGSSGCSRPATTASPVSRSIHRDLGLSPRTSAGVKDGWPWILDSMKSLLETGDAARRRAAGPADAGRRRRRRRGCARTAAQAIDANNSTWELLERWSTLTADEDDDLLGRAYAAAYHWRRASGAEAGQRGARRRGSCRAPTPCSARARRRWHHAERCLDRWRRRPGSTTSTWPTPSRPEPAPLACLGHHDEAAAALAAARAVPIADPEDAAILAADLAADPWFGLPRPTT